MAKSAEAVTISEFDLFPQPVELLVEEEQTPIERTKYLSVEQYGHFSLKHDKYKDHYRILRRCTSGRWNAARLEKDRLSANFQGNPKWPKIVLSDYKNVSLVLGLNQSADDNFCIIPRTKTINRAIENCLKSLGYSSHQIFKFKSEEEYLGRSGSDDRDYVDEFIDSRVLPMANDWSRDSIHDWSYHFLTLLFPDYLENIRLCLKVIRKNLYKFRGNVKYEWNFYGHTVDNNGLMIGRKSMENLTYHEALYRQMAISLDVGSAKIVQLLNIYKQGLLGRCKNETRALQDYLTGVSPLSIRRILWQEKEILKTIDFHGYLGRNLGDEPIAYILDHLTLLDKTLGKTLLIDRSQAYDAILRKCYRVNPSRLDYLKPFIALLKPKLIIGESTKEHLKFGQLKKRVRTIESPDST